MKFSISAKISLFSSLIIFVLLSAASIALLKFESDTAMFIIKKNISVLDGAFDKQEKNQQAAFNDTMTFHIERAGALAAPFLYNFNSAGLSTVFKSYKKLSEIIAVEIFDSDGEPFFALWETSSIETGESLPESAKTGEHLLVKSAESYFNEEKVGKVVVYYTDALLMKKIRDNEKNAKFEITSFRNEIEKRIQRAFVVQITGIICIVLSLIIIINICLTTIAIKPVRKIIDDLYNALCLFSRIRDFIHRTDHLIYGIVPVPDRL